MRIFEPEEPDHWGAGEGGDGAAVGARERPFGLEDLQEAPRGRSVGVWILMIVDLLLAGLAVGALLFLSGAENYLINDSAEFGSELNAALYGVWALKIASYVLIGGFLISAAAVLSLTRLGWRLQFLWALLLSLTIAGLLYGAPTLVFLRRRTTRARFFGPSYSPG